MSTSGLCEQSFLRRELSAERNLEPVINLVSNCSPLDYLSVIVELGLTVYDP